MDKMDKRALYDQFHRVESRISSMGADVKEIQEKMDDLIEENANLQI
ncbi:MAG: DNA replication initiation control protein YabA, partial [Trichococcus flocculiformis]|nr:DNA replication initiation control protein YabA [Trichococcus flocculiformis]